MGILLMSLSESCCGGGVVGFKTKHDSHGNLECYKARLVGKGFTQKDDIDYKEMFSPIS